MAPAVLKSMSPAWQSVLELIRHGLGTERVGQPRVAEEDAAELLSLVRQHRVASFLLHRLPVTTLQSIPISLRTELRTGALETARRALMRTGELIRISTRLQQADIPHLTFKGPVLAQQLYGAPSLRHAGDIDLLVAPRDVRRTDELLCELGFERSYPKGSLSDTQWKHFLRAHHELNHLDRRRGLMVELQWHLDGLPETTFAPLWEERVLEKLGGRPVATLAPGIMGVFLFVHAARHQWGLLFWLVDVALLIRDSTPEQHALLKRCAETQGALRSILQGALLAEELLGIRMPPEWRAAAESDPAIRPLADAALAAMQGAAGPKSLRRLMAEFSYAWRLAGTWSARASLVRPRLLSVENWRILPLPNFLFWMYYPLAPILWLIRKKWGAN